MFGAVLVTGSSEPAALPMANGIVPDAPVVLVEDAPAAKPSVPDEPSEAADGAPLAQLNEALAAARAKLEQLNQAAEALAGAAALRDELAALQDENGRLTVELQSLRTAHDDLQRAETAARAQITELDQALDETRAEAKELDGQLAALRWQNAQLTTSLSRARTAQEQAVAETESVRAELSARVAELEQAVDRAGGEAGRLRAQLAVTTERLNVANSTLTEAEQERDMVLGQLDVRSAEAERLSGELEAAEAELERVKAANQGLETRLAGLELAANTATDTAKQNLLAVESQIAALSATLAKVDLSAADDAARSGAGKINGGAEIELAERIDGAAAAPEGNDRNPATAAAPAAGASEEAEASASQLALVKLSDPTGRRASPPLAELTALLPTESRIQAQSLVADLGAQAEARGLKMVVPGEQLFATNSGQVLETAHESLAKVAELINLYKGQPVLIVGHTDARGAEGYNRALSERRAKLVKEFFVEHFDVAADRVSTEGMGEQRPIATNATTAGRRANRRIEVLILN